MKEATKIIKAIASTSSYTDKITLLRRNAAVPHLKDILRFIYNPYCKTGISDAKLAKAFAQDHSTERSVAVDEAIQYFSTHQTGSDADLQFARNFILTSTSAYGPDAGRLASAMVTQNLRIGVSVTALNTAYGDDFIPKVGCMLGTPYADVSRVAWPCIVTEKLDGIRRILIKEHGVCRMYSRSGHEDTGLVEILKDAEQLPDNFMYDGELLAAGAFKDSIALRQATNSLAASKGVKKGLTFNVFDMVPIDEFYAGRSKANALARKLRLGATLMDDSIQILEPELWAHLITAFGIYQDLKTIRSVPILGLAQCIDDIDDIVAEIWARGGEGVMLNTATGPYEVKRSKQLLKIKHSEERVLTVVNMTEGTGKFEGMLGALVVIYKDNYLGVGSGFTDDQRRHIWDNPGLYIGRNVEIETFGESVNSAGEVSLNCPIFKRFVGEVE